MVTGIEFTWIEEDVVRMKWEPVINENILGYKISYRNNMIDPPIPAMTGSNISEYDIRLWENVGKLYIYIRTYNYLGDGPLTNTCK